MKITILAKEIVCKGTDELQKYFLSNYPKNTRARCHSLYSAVVAVEDVRMRVDDEQRVGRSHQQNQCGFDDNGKSE